MIPLRRALAYGRTWPFLVLLLCAACAAHAETATPERSLSVTATAYTSRPQETQGNPNITAFGERLTPGIKAIAVSRDLEKMGLTHGTKVSIDGLKGEYTVMDRMARRWKRKIDIYMGTDVKRARQWGKRTVTIRW